MVNDGTNRLAIARELNATGMPTARGSAWTNASVGNVLRRSGDDEGAPEVGHP
jgi:hypothetical protein